jgi:hypothetical protein
LTERALIAVAGRLEKLFFPHSSLAAVFSVAAQPRLERRAEAAE